MFKPKHKSQQVLYTFDYTINTFKMDHNEGTFTGIKGFRMYYQCWVPDTSPMAIVLICHGIAEHSGRYAHVAEIMVSENCAVYSYDLRGHGKSEGKRCDIDRFDQFIDDTKLFFDLIVSENPGLPVFLLGHSMGSLIAIQFAHRYGSLIQGLVISGSGNRAGGDVGSVLIGIVKVLSVVVPHLSIKATDLSKYLSHDPAEVEKNRKDPLVHHGGICTRLAAEMLRSFNLNEQLISELKIPVLFQAGSGDQLVLGATQLASQLTMTDKTIFIYEGLWHEIYNEAPDQRKAVLTDLVSWIGKMIRSYA
jgi:alpha-beta hydrolase superfamily lysophospholipase